MTHDEFLRKLNQVISDYPTGIDETPEIYYKGLLAIRSLLELHKPYGEFIDGKPSFRCQANHEKYPCPTIQKIMDELK